jgi:hypothetical protein
MPAMQIRAERRWLDGRVIPTAESKGSFEVAYDNQKRRLTGVEN